MSAIDKIDRRLGNMRMMLERLGIDPVAFSSQANGRFLAAALPACQECSCEEKCYEWLSFAPAALERAPNFCPNAQLFVWAKEDVVRGDLH